VRKKKANNMSVIVRFAPSPTGSLHIGSVRTAIFNWLFARGHGGKFLLRIEDTDKLRSTPENTSQILEILKWLEIDWDGEAVIQSSRIERHRQVALSLVDSGCAYFCYCSQEELALKKESAIRDGKSYKYDGTCRHKKWLPPALSGSETDGSRWESDAAWLKQEIDGTVREEDPTGGSNIRPAVRLKSRTVGDVSVNDLVQGEIAINSAQLDDLVLLRSDGTPTYMLSVVVDDHDMGITHVIRGDDHMTNTFRQIQIYEACGWSPPEFGHIPLIYGPDGAKLSKRHGAASARDYMDLGYLPEAVCNYLIRLGWSHGDDEIISRCDALKWFSLESVGKSPSRFDMAKLQNLNAHYMRGGDNAKLLELIIPFLKCELTDLQRANILRGMDSLKRRSKTLIDLAEASRIYINCPDTFEESCKKYATQQHLRLLKEAIKVISMIAGPDVSEETLLSNIKEIADTHGVKLVEIAQALRGALCGRLVSPSVFEVMSIIGADESESRIRAYIKEFSSNYKDA
jgi:glutamyl-tRNA synthetase